MEHAGYIHLDEIVQLIGDAHQGDSLLIPVTTREQAKTIHKTLAGAYPYSRFIIVSELEGTELNCRITVAYNTY